MFLFCFVYYSFVILTSSSSFFCCCCYGGQICERFENFVHLEVRVVNLLNVKFCSSYNIYEPFMLVGCFGFMNSYLVCVGALACGCLE